MINEKVLICGICKNVVNKLPYSIKIMEKIGELFQDYLIFIEEDSSIDGTKNILKNWGNKKLISNSYNYTQEELKQINNWHNDGTPFKPEIISLARNRLMERIEKSEYNEYKYIIFMDMDFIKEPDYIGIEEIFKNPEKEWNAIFAYGIAPNNEYWDKYAFRDNNHPLGPELLGHNEWYIPKDVLRLNPNSSWYSVYSAFGGCGIYKREEILGLRYSGIVDSKLDLIMKNFLINNRENLIIQQYFENSRKLKKCIITDLNLNNFKDYNNVGFIYMDNKDSILWRMNSFVYNCVGICEHVYFNFLLINKGYDRLFINPRLIFKY